MTDKQPVQPAPLELKLTATEAARAEATRVLEGIGEDPLLSLDAIDRYARAAGDAALVRARWERYGCSTTTAGSGGQLVTHPMIKAVRDAELNAAALAERLGLTPAARKALSRTVGHPVGQGQAPDRQRAAVRRVA